MVSYSSTHHITLAKRHAKQLAIDGDGGWLPGVGARTFAFKSDIFLHSLPLVMSGCDNALVKANQMRQIIQKCWSLVFAEKSESLLISLRLVTSERDNGLAAADQMPQQSCWSSMCLETLLFDSLLCI
jgi:hypothetical protein